jgi:hypothetical protein
LLLSKKERNLLKDTPPLELLLQLHLQLDLYMP